MRKVIRIIHPPVPINLQYNTYVLVAKITNGIRHTTKGGIVMYNLKKPLRLLAGVCAFMMLAGCQPVSAPTAQTPETAVAGVYTPGTYTASAQGYGGPVEVSVEVDASAILNVMVTANKETEGVGSKAIDSLPGEIVKSQSTAVDGVSGATLSSKAIIQAVNSALSQAKGESPETGNVTFKPGTYTTSVYGNNDYMNVEMTFDETSIVSVNVTKHSETKFLGEAAIPLLCKDIVAYQTLNVDTISGATVTSNALKSAAADCVTQAGVDPSALQAQVPPKAEKSAQVTEQTADVIIIGAGGAGLSAAVTAAQAGASVIVLEKMPVVGGNTVRCASAYNTADPDRQEALPMTDTLKAAVEKAIAEEPVNDDHAKLIADVKAAYESYQASGSETLFDCAEWHALQTYNGGDKIGFIPLIRKYAENTLDTLHWLAELGAPLSDKVSQGAGALWQRTHQIAAPAGTGIIEPLYNKAMELNVIIKTNMKADSLNVENGRVTSVTAYDQFGSEYRFSAGKGVVLATGGFSNNKEMRAEYNPALTPDMVSTNQPGATGDGILMATVIGAGTTGMEYIQVYPLATPGSGALQGRARKMSGLDDVIVVNKNGKRFISEDARRDEFVAAIKQQQDALVYDINDSTIVEEYNSFDENVETLVSLGRIYKADTLAGLEEQLGMPAGSLQQTVAEYNQMVADQNDPVFGRKLFDKAIEVGPFYATPRAPSIHHTMGGITIDTDARVLDENGAVMPGLFAAGEVTGGIHGSNRLGGNATADALTFGRIAGQSVVTD